MIEALSDTPSGVTGILVSSKLSGLRPRRARAGCQTGFGAVLPHHSVFGWDELEQAKQWAAG